MYNEALQINLCIFCCKISSGPACSGVGVDDFLGEVGREKVFDQFLIVLGHYVGTKVSKESLLSDIMGGDVRGGEGKSISMGACENCSETVKSFNELYFQMIRVKLEMNWKLEMIVKEIETSGRKPSRIKSFKEAFDSRLSSGGGRGGKMLRKIIEMRAEVVKKCREKLSRSKPLVILGQPLQLDSNEENENANISLTLDEPTTSEGMENCQFDNDFIVDDDYDNDDSGERSVEQKFCPDEFAESSPGSLNIQPLDSLEDSATFACTQCPERFSFKSHLSRHIIKSHSEPTSLRSSRRSRTRTSYKELEGSDTTDDNDDDDEYKEAANETEEEETRNQNFVCCFCSKSFSFKYKNNVVRHLRDNHSLSLEQAKETFNSRIDTKVTPAFQAKVSPGRKKRQHSDTDEGNDFRDTSDGKPYQCSQCSIGFSYQITLDRHMTKFHSTAAAEEENVVGDSSEHPFACQKCSRTFKAKFRYDIHMRTYHGVRTQTKSVSRPSRKTRSYTCSYCQRNFSFKQNLNRHIKLRHRGKNRNRFQRIDIKQEPLDMEFGDTESQIINKIPVKSLKCPHCSTGFSYELTLQKHLAKFHPEGSTDNTDVSTVPEDMQDQEEGSLVCSVCRASFIREKMLYHHLKRYHPFSSQLDTINYVKPRTNANLRGAFKCSFCSRVFSFKSNLNRHVKSHHRKQYQSKNQSGGESNISDYSEANSPAAVGEDDTVDFSISDNTKSSEISGLPDDRYRHACNLCPKRYTLRQNLYRHRKEAHYLPASTSSVKKKSVPAVPGTVRFPSVISTNVNHVNRVEKPGLGNINHEFKYICALCPKTANFKCNLIKHLRTAHSLSLDEAKYTFNSQVKKISIDEFRRKMQDPNAPSSSITPPSTVKSSTEIQLVCLVCSLRFKNPSTLNTHLRKFHLQNISSNEDDKTGPTTMKKVSGNTAKETYQCPIADCHEKFDLPQDLIEHQLLHGSFKCSLCEVVKDFAPDLAVHEMEAHLLPDESSTSLKYEASEQNYKCIRCNQSYAGRTNYVFHHVETHLNLKMSLITCDICQIRFRNTDSLDLDHFQSHHAIAGLDPNEVKRCDHENCTAYFLRPFQLFYHKLKIHGVDERKKCPECGKICSLDNNLRKHRKEVHKFNDEDPNLPVPCQVPHCKKRFSTVEEMEWHWKFFRHMQRDGNPVTCPECDRLCVGPDGLRIHMRAHRPKDSDDFQGQTLRFICEQCGVAFKANYLLQKHYLYHKDPEEWEHICPTCGKKLPTGSKLQRHIKFVHGEREFSCHVCGRAFSQRQHLQYHVKAVHKIYDDDK